MIRPIVGPDVELEPGTGFGPLVGVARALGHDMAWPMPWTPLIQRSLLDRLLDLGIQLDAVETEIASPNNQLADFLELVILPGIRFASVPGELSEQRHCPTCGVALPTAEQKAAELMVMRAIARGETVADVPYTLMSSTLTSRHDIFRPSRSNIIVVTERLFEAMQILKAENVEFRPVQAPDFDS